MKYTLIHCYSDNNKGDSGIILSTINLLRKYDRNAEIIGVSTYNYSDPAFRNEHSFLRKYIDVLPSIFGELNVGAWKNGPIKMIRFVFDLLRLLIIFLIPTQSSSIISLFLSKAERSTLHHIKTSDYIISKGGSFICNENNFRDKLGLIRFMFIILLCFRFNKKVVILAQSIGPVYGRISTCLINYILKNCFFVVLREKECLKEYRNLQFESYTLRVLNDIAFHLTNQLLVESHNNRTKIQKYSNGPSFGFTLKDVNQSKKEDYFEMVTQAIKHCVCQKNGYVYIFPQVTIDNDIDISLEVYRRLPDGVKKSVTVYTENYTALELTCLYSQMDYFIGTRLHSTIFAMGSNIPSICVSYHGTKAKGVFSNFGLEHFVIQDYSAKSIMSQIDNLMDMDREIRVRLNQKIDFYFNEYLKFFDVIFQKEHLQ